MKERFTILYPKSNELIAVTGTLTPREDRQYLLEVHDKYAKTEYSNFWNPFDDVFIIQDEEKLSCYLGVKTQGGFILKDLYKWAESDYFTFYPGMNNTGYLHDVGNGLVTYLFVKLHRDRKEGIIKYDIRRAISGIMIEQAKSVIKNHEFFDWDKYINTYDVNCIVIDDKQYTFKSIEPTQKIDDYIQCYRFTYYED